MAQANFDAAFYQALLANVTTAVGTVGGNNLQCVESAAPFPYRWQTQSADMTATCFAYLDQNVVTGSTQGAPAVKLQGSFSTQFAGLVQGITAVLSDADNQKVRDIRAKADNQAMLLLQAYRATFGEPPTKVGYTPADSAIAAIADAAGVPFADFANTVNLNAFVDKLPGGMRDLLPAASAYLNVSREATIISASQATQQAAISTIATNVTAPSKANGGMTINTQPTDPVRYVPALKVTSDFTTVNTELAKAGNTIKMTMTATRQQDGSYTMSMNGGGGASFSFLGLVSIGGSGSVSKDVFTAAGDAQSCTVTMTFPGVTTIDVNAAAYSNGQGWYAPNIVAAAQQNTPVATSGYTLSAAAQQQFKFGKGGNFGRVSKYIVSQPPTVSIHFEGSNYSDFQEKTKTTGSGGVSIFGFTIGGGKTTFDVKSNSSSQAGGFDVNLAPPAWGDATPNANVIAVVVDYPGA